MQQKFGNQRQNQKHTHKKNKSTKPNMQQQIRKYNESENATTKLKRQQQN